MLLSTAFARMTLAASAPAARAVVRAQAPSAANAQALLAGVWQAQGARGYYKARNGGYFGKVNRKNKDALKDEPPKPKVVKETVQQINDRVFGMFPAYVEAKAAGSATPVLDALSSEKPDPEMLKIALQLAKDVLPERAGPRKSREHKRARLKQKRIRAQHAVAKRQKIAAYALKVKKAQERRERGRALVVTALEQEKAWQEEKAARRAQQYQQQQQQRQQP
eukprot:TRINITY_DN4714_c0_g1_i1.p1 TRINITY_DN4714_c0_g1~~TRINITY_DN4714_c0_g1_i1.p1  ORF type:complete len:241 (+),score=57.52 TRINITY_DN4714_c0_g1_i1:58-723(+)